MIITISGAAGSGKSTAAEILAGKLGWPYYYIGSLRRKKAEERGLTLAEYNRLGETDPATDKEVDEFQAKLGETQNNFIMEGRTSWHFIPHSFKVYFDVDEKIGAERIFRDLKKGNNRNEDKELKDEKDVLRSNRNRKISDTKRYKQYYDINVYDKKNYDLIIDTSDLNAEEAFSELWKGISNKINKR